MSIDRVNFKAPQTRETYKAKAGETHVGEVINTSIPDKPKPPEISSNSWEKVGQSANKMHGGILNGEEGILSKLEVNLKKEDIQNPKIDKNGLNVIFGKTLEEKKKDIQKQLESSPKALEAFNKLSGSDKEKFKLLAASLYSSGFKIFGKSRGGKTDKNLIKLLEEGKLSDKDSKGKTLLDNLSSSEKQKYAEGLDSKTFLKEVISKIAEPPVSPTGSIGMFSNPLGDLEGNNIKNNPSEYARMMFGLGSEKGEVELNGGEILKRGKNALTKPLFTGLSAFGGVKPPEGVNLSQIYYLSIGEHIQNKKVSSEKKRKDILDQIKKTKKADEAYSKLSKEEKEKFLSIIEKTYIPGINIMDTEMPPNFNKDLIKLLEQGKLSDKDSRGKTFLDGLKGFQNQKFAEGINGEFLFGEVVSKLANSEKYGVTLTGVKLPDNPAFALEKDTLQKNPAEYLRIIAGLSGEKGTVELPSREVLNRNDELLKQQTHGLMGGLLPVDSSALFQTSVNQHVNENKVDSKEKRENILKVINNNEKAKKAFDKLPKELQDKLLTLLEKDFKPGLKVGNSGMSPQINQNLLKLLEDGKLSDKDSKGKTLIENLFFLSEQKFPEGIDGKSIFNEVLTKLVSAQPVLMSGFGLGPDPVAVMERDNIKNNPSEYIRIIAGLTGEKGEVKLPGGEILKRDDEFLKSALKEGGPFNTINSSMIYRSSMRKALQEKKAGPEEKNKDLMKHIESNLEAKKAFLKLSEEDKKKFLDLLRKTYRPGIKIMGSELPSRINFNLIEILESGKLSDKDSKGKTLLDNLSALENQKFAEGIDGKRLFDDLLGKIARGGTFGSGKKDFFSKLEEENIKNNPSEYLRIMAGLTSEKGEVTLQNGEILKIDKEKLKDLISNKSMVFDLAGDIYQSSIKKHMETKEVTKKEKRDFILKELKSNEKAYKIFQELSEKDREAFITLLEGTYSPEITIMGSKILPGIDRNLIKLLEQDKLLSKDNRGNTLLHNLSELQNQKFASRLDGKQIFRETVENIVNPDKIRQNNKGTCTVTTMEYINAKNYPAEFARIVAGLTGEKGEIELNPLYEVSDSTLNNLKNKLSPEKLEKLESILGKKMSPSDLKMLKDLGFTDEQIKAQRTRRFLKQDITKTLKEMGFSEEEIKIALKETEKKNILKRDEGIIKDDYSGRTAVDRIYQASMMEYANGEKEYDNLTDSHYSKDTGTLETEDTRYRLDKENINNFKEKITDPEKLKKLSSMMDNYYTRETLTNELKNAGFTPEEIEFCISKFTKLTDHDSGLYDRELKKIMDGVLPYESEIEIFSNAPIWRENFEDYIKAALARGQLVDVSMHFGYDEKGDKTYHALAVEGIDENYVYLRNPWGDGDKGSAGDPAGSRRPQRETVPPGGSGTSGGHIRMTKEEFFSRLNSYLLPVDPNKTEKPVKLAKTITRF